ncbi:MAG: lipid ABC transporter [Micrococcales bacterium]|nr:MAG: lipid ABC transporter [Micrococcales bacterium]
MSDREMTARERALAELAEREPFDASGLRALLRYAKPHRAILLLGISLGIVGTAAALAQPLAAREVLETIGAEGSMTTPLMLLVALVLVDALLMGVHLYMLEKTGERMVLGIRVNLIERLLRLPVREYDQRPMGELLSRAGSDTTLLRAVVTANVLDAGSSVLMVGGSIAVMAYLDWVLLLVVLGVLVVIAGFVAPSVSRIKEATETAQEGVGQMTAALERALGAIRTVKASTAEDREGERVGEQAQAAYAAGVRSAKLDAIVGVATGLAVQLSFLVVLGVGGARVASGSMGAADLIAFLLYIFYLAAPLAVLANAVTELQKASAAANRIVEVERMPIELDIVPDSAPPMAVERRSEAPGTAMAPEVVFDGVEFSYRPDVPVLQGTSFRVEPGCKAALVGPSGAGKSTILALLERFYAPATGTIRLDGRDIGSIPLRELRRQIGYVEQDAPVLAGSLRDSLLYTAGDVADDEVAAVVRASRLEDLAARLPDGLDSLVGDRGVQLSGGERQRLAIGRLLLRRPRLVLLDEATSQLDSVNEEALRSAIDELARDCTMIVIAHRLSTVARSDKILLLDGGAIRATGTHEGLMEQSDLYRDLARGQLLDGDVKATAPESA